MENEMQASLPRVHGRTARDILQHATRTRGSRKLNKNAIEDAHNVPLMSTRRCHIFRRPFMKSVNE